MYQQMCAFFMLAISLTNKMSKLFKRATVIVVHRALICPSVHFLNLPVNLCLRMNQNHLCIIQCLSAGSDKEKQHQKSRFIENPYGKWKQDLPLAQNIYFSHTKKNMRLIIAQNMV